MFGILYLSIKMFVWMFKLMTVTLVVCVAVFAWMFYGLGWLVTPDKPAMARSARNFNRSVGHAIRRLA